MSGSALPAPCLEQSLAHCGCPGTLSQHGVRQGVHAGCQWGRCPVSCSITGVLGWTSQACPDIKYSVPLIR